MMHKRFNIYYQKGAMSRDLSTVYQIIAVFPISDNQWDVILPFVVITVPADGLARNGAMVSVGAVITSFGSSQYHIGIDSVTSHYLN